MVSFSTAALFALGGMARSSNHGGALSLAAATAASKQVRAKGVISNRPPMPQTPPPDGTKDGLVGSHPQQELAPFFPEVDLQLWFEQQEQRQQRRTQALAPISQAQKSQLCTDFEQCYLDSNSQYNPNCDCNSYTTYHEAVCYDATERCLDGTSIFTTNNFDRCAKTWAGPHFDLFSGKYKGSWTSYQFTNPSGTKTTLSMWNDPTNSDGDTCFLNVNNEACQSCFFKDCTNSFGMPTGKLGFEADCSNLGYGAGIDSCSKAAVGAEKFRLFFDGGEFHLKCSREIGGLGPAVTIPPPADTSVDEPNPTPEPSGSGFGMASTTFLPQPTPPPTSGGTAPTSSLVTAGAAVEELYPYVADSADGFLSWSPEVDIQYEQSSLIFDATTGDNIVNADQCATRCFAENAPSGAWNSRLNICFCYLVAARSMCKEPCIAEEGVEFSTLPIEELDYCEESFCHKDWFYDTFYCDEDLGFDEEACDAKIQELMNVEGSAIPVPSSKPTDGPQFAPVPVPAPIGPLEPEGIEINQCSDTLGLFGDSDRSNAFIDAVTCSCTGNLTASYNMECSADNYCFDWYSHGKMCADIVFKYDFVIDPSTGRLLNSGFVGRSTCTTFLSGNGPGVGTSTQCKVSNPQCILTLRDDHSLSTIMASTVCSNQVGCPGFFADLGYDDETAASQCPKTYLDDTECLTGADSICGHNEEGSFVTSVFASVTTTYSATADCSNVVPCAKPLCLEAESWDPEEPRPIRNGPIYPACIVPTGDGDESIVNSVGEGEVLDLYMQESYLKFTSGSVEDSEDVCGGICSDPESGCIPSGRQFFLQGHCYPIASLSTGKVSGSRSYYTDGTKLCFDRYADQHCQVLKTANNCEEIDLLETCSSNANLWKIVQAHCIRSSTAQDDYVVPMIERHIFTSDGNCTADATGDALAFLTDHGPDAPNLCQTGSYPQRFLSQPRLPGGVRNYCDPDGSGEHIVEFYTNDDCTEQDNDNMYRAITSIGSCKGAPFPELGVPEHIRYDITGCLEGEAQYFCKDLAVVGGLGTEIEADPQPPALTSVVVTELYPYVADSADGFLSWSPEVDVLYEQASLIFDATTGDNIVNADQCAAKCFDENAPSGAWNSRFNTCFCYLVEARSLCKEPCIQEEGVEFSTLSIEELDYCEKSFCHKDWFYDALYCDEDLGFDEEACDAKIQDLTQAATSSTSSTIVPPTQPSEEATAYPKVFNGASARPLIQNVTQPNLVLPRHNNESQFRAGSFPYLIYAIEDKRELWATNGEEDSTQLATWEQWQDSRWAPTEAHYQFGRFHFLIGSSLWVTDGTADNTLRAKVFEEETLAGTRPFVSFQDDLYIALNSSLYKTDGTSPPVLVQTFPTSIRDMAVFEELGFILISSRPNYEEGTTNVFKTDGSNNGAILLTSDAFEARLQPHNRNPVLSNGNVLFSADNGLWRTDGTPAETVQFITQGGMRFGPPNIFANGRVHTGVDRFAFTTGGTSDTTSPLLQCSSDFVPNSLVPNTTCFDVEVSTSLEGYGVASGFMGAVATGPFMDGRLMIMSRAGHRGISEKEIYSNKTIVYMTDGTGEGTEKIHELPVRPMEGELLVDGRMILHGYNIEGQTDEIWILDGTTEGSYLLADLGNLLFTNDGKVLESLGSDFVLVSTGTALWRLDIPPRTSTVKPATTASTTDPTSPGDGSTQTNATATVAEPTSTVTATDPTSPTTDIVPGTPKPTDSVDGGGGPQESTEQSGSVAQSVTGWFSALYLIYVVFATCSAW